MQVWEDEARIKIMSIEDARKVIPNCKYCKTILNFAVKYSCEYVIVELENFHVIGVIPSIKDKPKHLSRSSESKLYR